MHLFHYPKYLQGIDYVIRYTNNIIKKGQINIIFYFNRNAMYMYKTYILSIYIWHAKKNKKVFKAKEKVLKIFGIYD